MSHPSLRLLAPVAAEALSRIATHIGRQWPAGYRLPSVRRLADELQTAPGTVVRALEELKARNLVVARPRLGFYVSNAMTDARLLQAVERLQTSATGPQPMDGRRVELIYRRSGEELIERMVKSLTDELTQLGATFTHQPIETTKTPSRIEPRSPDADAMVVLNPDYVPIACPRRQVLLIITTSGSTMVENTDRYDLVQVEQEQGGQLAGQVLRAAGCAGACFIGVHNTSGGSASLLGEPSAARRKGFIAGWGSDQIVTLATHSYGPTPGAHLAHQYAQLKPRPQAVFAASDELAMGFFWGAAGAGLAAIRDYHLVGFDGQSRGQTLPGVALTTIGVPAEEMGRRGAHLLVSRILDPDQAVRRLALGCHLIRGNTAAVRA